MLKRKPPAEGADDLSDYIKRCRINTTPGQLRLNSDVKDLQANVPSVVVETTDDPMQVIVRFLDGPPEPSAFSFTVSRFYPHERPLVRCISPFSPVDCQWFASDGSVLHPELQAGWTGIHTLSSAVTVLERVRAGLASGEGDSMIECVDSC